MKFRFLAWIFKGFFRNVGKFGRWFGGLGKLIPVGLSGLFILSQFIFDWITQTLPIAFYGMAKTIFTAELVINEKVHMAIANSPQYGIFDFLHIIVSIFVLFFFIKTISNLMIKSFGANENFGAYIWAIIIVGIIEIAGIAVIDGSFGFIPFWNGIIFLFLNIDVVLGNIFTRSAIDIVVNNVSMNISANSTS